MTRKVYYLTNFFMIGIASTWLCMHQSVFIKMIASIDLNHLYYLLLAIALFVFLHLLKALRLYIILLESNISSYQLLKQYFKTTIITLLIPFKIGDFFRIICFSKATKSVKTGISSILIDRFFDTVVILTFLLIYQLIDGSDAIVITLVILLFLIILCLIYVVFSITYPYLNHFIIIHGVSKNSLVILDYLEQIKVIQESITRMIKNRTALILLISILAWTIEFFTLNLIMHSLGKTFDFIDVGIYLEHSFLGQFMPIHIFYFCLGSIILLLLTSYTYLKSIKEGRPHV